MKIVRNKIKSKHGASALVGLVIFVVCAVLSAVITSASSIVSGTATGYGNSEQSYLTICSAAKIIQEDLRDSSFLYDGNGNTTVTSEKTDGIVQIVKDIVTSGMKNGTHEETVTATFTSSEEDSECIYNMDISFSRETLRLVITIRPSERTFYGSASETDLNAYNTTLLFDAARVETEEGKTHIYYSEGVLQ